MLLLQQEEEFLERQAEEEEQSDVDHNRDSALLQSGSSQMSPLGKNLLSPESIVDSDSDSGLLSPVPGSTHWEDEITEVVLVKGSQGLGFSILDFSVSQGSLADQSSCPVLQGAYHSICCACSSLHNDK